MLIRSKVWGDPDIVIPIAHSCFPHGAQGEEWKTLLLIRIPGILGLVISLAMNAFLGKKRDVRVSETQPVSGERDANSSNPISIENTVASRKRKRTIIPLSMLLCIDS